jgi:hypothetical protein
MGSHLAKKKEEIVKMEKNMFPPASLAASKVADKAVKADKPEVTKE